MNGLQRWYARQCNGLWEHQHGVTISTLDNPGWSMKIDLLSTNLEKIEFLDVKIERSDADWIVARRVENEFEAYGGVGNLDEMIDLFLSWDKENRSYDP